MLEPISIGTYTDPVHLFEKLNNELRILKNEGIPLDINIDEVGSLMVMDCCSPEIGECNEVNSLNTVKYSIANCLADIIVDEWEIRIIKKIVSNDYYYYNEEEKEIILSKAKEMLNPTGINMYHQKQRREKVMLKILDYLDSNKDLVLEGFISFRLKDYENELEGIVNSAVDEFLLEKEYMEFIKLLKYFVEIQEPRIEKIQVLIKSNGKFSLLDERDKPVKHECLEGLMLDSMENEINYDDLLISALITIAPRELILHIESGVKSVETVTIIQNVFGSRVKKCLGCKKCDNINQTR
ncbi:MAG: putative sporulation protein YtxC [Clostridia bacterium]|nr:putative sporulation protein YtxC [Clostridia bacterium]MDD4048163.1 putative sporulation protein YtxC [Clostridia bacterium]